MNSLRWLWVITPASIGGAIPLYQWHIGRRAGEIPSRQEWIESGEVYPPWHCELTSWVAVQIIVGILILTGGLLAKRISGMPLRRSVYVGGLVWLSLLIVGLSQYGWAIAD